MPDRTCTIDGCNKPAKASRGWCWMHYYRWRRFGDPNRLGRVIYGTPEERFWPKVDKTATCWLWTASVNASGYGVFSINGKTVLAHRWAYEHSVGPIPEGMEIDHVRERGCRHRHCVNPAHLEPVTDAENTARSPVHYGARTHCSNGHEFTAENTIARLDGGRRCRTCKSAYGKTTYQRQRRAARLGR